MSRYIDAEWIRNVYADFEHYENRDDWTTPITNVLAVIDDAPSIDIVRCKECQRKYVTGDTTQYYVCDFMDAQYEENGYCHHGERIEK